MLQQSIRLSENAFRNLEAGNMHVMSNPQSHTEMKNLCKQDPHNQIE